MEETKNHTIERTAKNFYAHGRFLEIFGFTLTVLNQKWQKNSK